MKVGFFAEKCLPFDALTLDERPLGGTETGIIRLADELALNGHEVTVLTSKKDPRSGIVKYLESSAIKGIEDGFDVLILVKDFAPINFPLPASKIVYLTGDGPDQYVNFGVGDKRVWSKLHGMLAVSRWHAHAMSEASGFPIGKISIIGNGVHLPYFQGEEQRNSSRLIFTSAPYRGLNLAYVAFCELQKEFSDLELHIFSGFKLYDTETSFSGPLVKEFELLKSRMATNKGCVFHGNVTQRELSREYMKSSLLFYPNTILETCCIIALEAQAAGCPVIASNNSALPETVREGGFVVSGRPGTPEYFQELLYLTRQLLRDRLLWQRVSDAGREKVWSECSWANVAQRFLAAVS